METMFRTSDATDLLDAALAKAQGAVKAAIKDANNPHFGSKYADLASVWAACRDALAANLISVTQWPVHSDDGRLHIVTRLAHAGQWMAGEWSVPVGKADAHGYMSANTYARRGALAAAVGVAPDDDDDGNQATGKPAPEQRGAAAGRGNGDTARARSPRPSRPAAEPPPPSSAGGTTHPGGISAATYEALTDLCQQLQATGGDPGKVIHELTGKRKRAELTEEEGRAVGQAMLSLVVEGKKAGEAA